MGLDAPTVAPHIEALEALRLPERLSVVEWAEKNHRMSPRYSAAPGAYSTTPTPYVREILETFADPYNREITLLFASQCGKTTILELMMLYSAGQDPGPAIWAFPSEKSRDAFTAERLRPTIEGSPAYKALLADRGRAFTREKVDFLTMPLFFAIADSEADLASKSCRYVFADEVDKFPASTTREGSPLDQLRARQRAFKHSRPKFVDSSTPTTYEGAIWRRFHASDRRVWQVPCPSCGKLHKWVWDDVRAEPRDPKTDREEFARQIQSGAIDVWWQCPSCSHQVRKQADKSEMNANGSWFSTRPGGYHAGFHLNSLASPFTDFRELMAEFRFAVAEQERGNNAKMQHFVIHQKAEPYRQKTQRIEEQSIADRTDLALPKGVVPDWAEFVTMGIDVQHDRLVMVAKAWRKAHRGSNRVRCHYLDWAILPGRIETDFAPLVAATCNKVYQWQTKTRKALPLATFLDSGDGFTQAEVYRYANSIPGDRVFPIKGASSSFASGSYVKRYQTNESKKAGVIPARTEHNGKLILVDTHKTKSFDARLMARDPSDDCAVTFAAEAVEDPDFQRQLCSEETNSLGKWIVRSGYEANHYLDAGTYATAAAMHRGLMDLSGKKTLQQKFKPKRPPLDDDRAVIIGQRNH